MNSRMYFLVKAYRKSLEIFFETIVAVMVEGMLEGISGEILGKNSTKNL